MDDYQIDRFSGLHDSLILAILSYLPMEDVVRTTLLSKRWNNLWPTVSSLNFEPNVSYDEQIARNFVNKVILFWKGIKITKLEIGIWPHFDIETLAGDMDSWVRFGVDNKVEDLNIDLSYESKRFGNVILYWAPQCLYSCSSLKELSLVGCNLRIHGPPSWHWLKSLKINGYCFTECAINLILSGSPLLEEFDLCVYEINENLSICSTSLKTLTLQNDLCASLDAMLRLKICCANLQKLQIYGALYSKYFFKDVSSLTDATLDFHDYNYDRCYESELLKQSQRQLISTLCRVERLVLSDWCFQVLGASMKKHSVSSLPNVTFLKLNAYQSFKLGDMMNLLRIFPNLSRLVIKHYSSFMETKEMSVENLLEFEIVLSEAFLRLKRVDIESDLSDSSILQCIELLLKHASALEKLVITLYSQEELLNVVKKLLSMPRSSPMAKIILDSKYIGINY